MPSRLEGTLPRRGFFGLSLGPDAQGNPRVGRVAAAGPAHAAGLRGGEAVVAVDGQPPGAAAALRARLASLAEGTPVRLRIGSAQGQREVTLIAAPRPLEEHPGCEVVYGELKRQGYRLRTLVVRPEGQERAPFVFFVQGHGRGSVDGGGEPEKPLPALARSVASAGFAFVRVERPGEGDSEGPPLEGLSLADEQAMAADAYAAASAAPRAGEGFVLGHSLGALVGCELAASGAARPRGLVVYGGGVRLWTEYFDDNCRRQWSLSGAPLVEQERALRALQRFHALLLIEGLTLPQVLARMPEVADEPGLYGVESEQVLRGRPYGYWQEVYRTPAAERLASVGVPVLAAWGTSDWLSSRRDHELIAACVNEGQAGMGTFVEIEGADHHFAERETVAASFEARDAGALCGRVTGALVRWMREQLGG